MKAVRFHLVQPQQAEPYLKSLIRKNQAFFVLDQNSKGHWATPDALTHKSVHGVNYEVWISKQLRLTPAGDMLTKRLNLLKTGIKNGTYPVKIEEAKDPNWDGRS